MNMMVGIRSAVKGVVLNHDYVLQPRDFKTKYYFELCPRRTKEKNIYKICKFQDYAPYIFHEIRRLYGITTTSYLKSIGPESSISSIFTGTLQTVSELISSGKSGSFFYYSADGLYFLH